MDPRTGIQRAVDKFDGSPSKLAEAAGNGVKRQHVEHWLKTGRVSSDKAPDVADCSGISLEDLNDRVNWDKVRKIRRKKEGADITASPAINSVAKEL
ncbi:hypothetical protein D9M73_103430 [compost metagenome]